MKHIFHIGSNDKGSVLLISILILLLLTVIGIAATNTTTIELLISGNDKVHKMAFYQADGGTEVGIELVEQNIIMAGFDSTDLANLGDVNVNVTSLNLFLNDLPNMPDDDNRDAFFPGGYVGDEPHTNLTIAGIFSLSTGSAIQMAAGYEGVGKGVAGGGSKVVYDIWSQHDGINNSEAIIRLQWRHVM